MTRPTLTSIEDKLEQVIQDVDKKVDKETLVLELESIKKDISALAYVVAGQKIEMYAACTTTEVVSLNADRTTMSIYFVGA